MSEALDYVSIEKSVERIKSQADAILDDLHPLEITPAEQAARSANLRIAVMQAHLDAIAAQLPTDGTEPVEVIEYSRHPLR